jgi:FMN reductase
MADDSHARPLVVGLGGSASASSVTNHLLTVCLDRIATAGLATRMFAGDELGKLPIYTPGGEDETAVSDELVAAVRSADAVILASPGYHGGMSGLLKNAIDHLEALRDDERPYLDGRVVGVIVAASGWQACGTALTSVRSTIHALRGWPTPFGVTVNSAEQVVDEDGVLDERADGALAVLAGQVTQFIGWQQRARLPASS